MSSRVTNQEAKAFALRHNSFGKALKNPAQGGPIVRQYERATQDDDFMTEHPRYPDYAYPDDQEEDTRMEKRISAKRWFGATPQIQLTEKDFDYLERKKEAQQLLKFKSFVEDSVPRGTPWAKEYFEKLMPGWYDSKVAVINEKVDLVQKFIDITIRGPQSIDDMFLLYNLYQGNITIPTSFSELIRPTTGNTLTDKTFHSGLFNPRRYLDSRIQVAKRNQDFLANFAIPGIDAKGATQADAATNWSASTPDYYKHMTHSDEINLSGAGDTDPMTPTGALTGFFPAGLGNTGGPNPAHASVYDTGGVNVANKQMLGRSVAHRGELRVATG